MVLSRRKARELAFKVLFQVDQVGADPRDSFNYLVTETNLSDENQEFSWNIVDGVLKHNAEIDRLIQNHTKEWALERIAAVDRNILRIGIFEILYEDSISPVIAIDEAIEIAKRYGEDNSAAFINAVLDRICKSHGQV